MNFNQAKIGMDILEPFAKDGIGGNFAFEHDQCWITLPQADDNPDLTDDDRKVLEAANWFFDDEVDAWSHF